VGSSTVINGNANFRFKEGVISIGSNCLFANNVTLICNTYCVNGNQYVSSDRMYSKDIRIGDHVWVGSNVVILPGVDIGDNVIIGASSLVTKDVPSNEVWGGVPAKLLYKR